MPIKNAALVKERTALRASESSELPFKQGDRVKFKTVFFSGNGQVVGMAPWVGYRNYGVMVQHEELVTAPPQSTNAYLKYSVVMVPLFDEVQCAMGHNVPTQIQLL